MEGADDSADLGSGAHMAGALSGSSGGANDLLSNDEEHGLSDMDREPLAARNKHTNRSSGSSTSEEQFLAGHIPFLHALMRYEHDTMGINANALSRCVRSANNLYDHLIEHGFDETQNGVCLMYNSFFQPLMREVLGPVMRQLLNDERQVQLVGMHNAAEWRGACQDFIRLVAKYLVLHVKVLQGSRLQPTIEQRLGEDLAPLLHALADIFEDNRLFRNRAFHADMPAAAVGWVPKGLNSWAAPLPQQHMPGAAAEAGSTASEVDLTAEPPQTPSRRVAATAWRAAMIDCFGANQGWNMLLQLVGQPERLGDYLVFFMMPLGAAAASMLPLRRALLLQPAAAVVQLVSTGLAAAPDLSVVEGSAANPEQRVAKLLLLVRQILKEVAGPQEAEKEVGPLQREYVLRLLCASAFTRQLAAIKQLRDLVAFYFQSEPQNTEALLTWLEQHGIVQLVLKSNLHQTQYAHQAQRVLSMLLQHGALSEDAIAFLWQLTEDASTFEAVKSNAYTILASLGSHMEATQLTQLFARLQGRASASGVNEAVSICKLLVGMAQRDIKGSMWREILNCMLKIQLRPGSPPELAGCHTVLELCGSYESAFGQDKCSLPAAQACIQQLKGESAVAAVVILHDLMSFWHKPERMRFAMQKLNYNAELLKHCLQSYSAWLRTQKKARSEIKTVEGPAAGEFTHREAVDAWHRLIQKVIYHGNYFLLPDQLLQILHWATEEAVTAYDAGQAWQLLILMIANQNHRKEITEQVACEFFLNSLCTQPASCFTLHAWRCFLAYMIALADWAQDLVEGDVSPQYATVTEETEGAVRELLWRLTLESTQPALAQASSHLLAVTVSLHMRRLLANEPGRWRQLLAAEVAHRLQQLRAEALLIPLAAEAMDGDGSGSAARQGGSPASQAPPVQSLQWFDPPASLAAAPSNRLEHEGARVAREHCRRILQYLAMLIEECQGKRLLNPPCHRSAWRGTPLPITVQLPAQQGHKPHKQELSLPANLPVGQLRRIIAEWLGKAPQFVRLLGGGREFESDSQTLADSRAGQQLIMASVNMKPNRYSGRNIAEEHDAMAAIDAFMHQSDVYTIALSIAQSPSSIGGPSSAGTNRVSGNRVALAALQLLNVLPTYPAALGQLRQLLLAPDGGSQLRRLLMHDGVDGGPSKPAVLLYALQCISVLLFPTDAASKASMENAAAAEQEALQRRLLLSGMLGALLELSTRQAVAAMSITDAKSPSVDPAVAAAIQSAMLLLLQHTHAALHDQQLVAASSVAAEEPRSSTAAEPAPGAGATSCTTEPMQVDSAPLVSGDEAVPAIEVAQATAALNPCPSASMAADAADTTTEKLDRLSTAEAGSRGSREAAAPFATKEELDSAMAALAALASAAARYVVCMLCCMLGCHPATPPQSPRAAPAAKPISAVVDSGLVYELCCQALPLLQRLAHDSSAAVHTFIVEESAATEAMVQCLLLHPTSSLRQLAAEWVPKFAAAASTVHRWALERIVQPLLLKEGIGSAEQMTLWIQFISSLEESEFPAARQLLQTLLQQLSRAIQDLKPIDGIANVVSALVRRLDCQELGLSENLAGELIHVCFPALTALQQLEAATLSAMATPDVVVGPGPADVTASAGGLQQQQQQVTQPTQAALTAAYASAERCIAAILAQHADNSSGGSREAAFDLLHDLMLHDSGCWQQIREQLLQNVHAAGRAVFVQRFSNIPLQTLRAPGAFAGLQNGGATCYMSSIFQQLYMIPRIRELILSAPPVPAQEQEDSIFHQLQVMFAHLALGVEPWFEPRGFWSTFKDYDGQPVNIREHQDAYEFFTRLQDSVDEHLRGQERPRAIHAALGGTFAQLITVIEAPQYRSEREEEFYQISLDVRGKRTLMESLDSYVSKELMDGQNQYMCDELGKKVNAEKRTLIKELPHTLVLHLKRFEWDYETYQRWKVKDRFQFPLKLDMWPYTVEGAEATDGSEASRTKESSRYDYELRGVVVHSGSAFAGHYFSYIKDRTTGGGWYCFDDTSVEPWDPARLDQDCFGGRFVPEGFTQECDRPNSAYMLFYERSQEPSGSDNRRSAHPAGAAAQDNPCRMEQEVAGRQCPQATRLQSARAEEQSPLPPAQDDVQPMAVSREPCHSAEAPVSQPDAALTAFAQPVAAAAPFSQPEEHVTTPFSMPQGLYETLLFSNLRQLGAMQLLSIEFCQFYWRLIQLLQQALNTGTARKAAKREPTSSPGGMDTSASGSGNGGVGTCDLQALTSRRGGDLQAVMADVAILCLDWCFQVALRGVVELRREVLGGGGRKSATSMSRTLYESAKISPTIAAAMLLHMASGTCSSAADALLTHHPAINVRNFVRDVVCLAADCLACQERRTEEAVHALRSYLDHLCGSTIPVLLQLQTTWHDDQLLEVLQLLAHPRCLWRRALLDAHLMPLLGLVRKVTERWSLLEPYEHAAHESGNAALCLLGSLLRRFHVPNDSNSQQERSRRKPSRQLQPDASQGSMRAHRNPHCLEGCEPSPMPTAVLEWLYGDVTFLRQLLMPGCLYGKLVFRLLAFLIYDNQKYAHLWLRAILEHLLIDDSDWRDLGADVAVVSEVLHVKDSIYEERLIAFFREVEGECSFFKEMTKPRRGIGCQHLLLSLALSVLVEAPEGLVREVLHEEGDAWLEWADNFLHRRRKQEQACADDESALPDSPTYTDLCMDGKDLDDLADTDMMWNAVDRLNAVLAPTTNRSRGTTSSEADGGIDQQPDIDEQHQIRVCFLFQWSACSRLSPCHWACCYILPPHVTSTWCRCNVTCNATSRHGPF